MNRRDFLQSSGMATLLAMSGYRPLMANSNPSILSSMINKDLLFARNQNRSTLISQNGMVCASQPLAAMVGVDILKAGGNCVDAAIATNAMLGLTEPNMCGIGGDLFAILWIEKEQKLIGLNASGRAPYDWTLEQAQKLGLESIPRKSPLSWTVPGCVSGWQALLDRFGKLNFTECLGPAIDYAEKGFPLSPIIAEFFNFEFLNNIFNTDAYAHPSLATVYNPDSIVPGYGDIFVNPLLAKSYRSIAKDGADAFYKGEIAEQIVAISKREGGFMSMRDLTDHHIDWVEPVSTGYRGWDVWEIPPNGQGITALQMLNILENFDIGNLEHNSAEHLHLLIEAKKLAFEDRAKYYADMEFANVPLEWLISKEYGKKRAALIDSRRARNDFQYGDPKLDTDTVYLCTADNEGNMVSLIQSIYYPFGSTICPDGAGFAMQNRGQAFSLDPDHRNRLESHKRPFHTIIPAFLTRDGKAVMPFGVMGGDFQPEGHSQVLMNMVDFGMSIQQAGEQSRISHVGSSNPWGGRMENGGELVRERGLPEATQQGLKELGHRFSERIISHGGYQAIWREENPRRYFGGSDPRKDGAALGY